MYAILADETDRRARNPGQPSVAARQSWKPSPREVFDVRDEAGQRGCGTGVLPRRAASCSRSPRPVKGTLGTWAAGRQERARGSGGNRTRSVFRTSGRDFRLQLLTPSRVKSVYYDPNI